MLIIQQILFLIVLLAAGYIIRKRILRIAGNINLGKDKKINDRPAERLKNMMLLAFGQKKMFDKPLVGFLHFLVYAGFILINIEILEIIIDGLTGTHRVLYSFLSGFYSVLIGFFEFLAIGVIVACVVFLIRRNILKLSRFVKPELNGFPKIDANIILIAEILLMFALLSMNAADVVLQDRGIGHFANVKTGNFAFSQVFIPFFNSWSSASLEIYERFAWWFHICGILAFAVYVTYSKHLHIVLAFPNTYFSRLDPKGEIYNMPVVTKEVKSMLGLPIENEETLSSTPVEPERFGAKDINDLSWKNLMDAYSCTECGRCTEQCPANITGKKLSPRKIMMDTRDRMEEVGKAIEAKQEPFTDGNFLLDNYITREELLACTSCNACVEACPVSINPLDIIIEMRRYMAMEESKVPGSWGAMFSNIENNAAPWKFSPSDRFNWAEKLKS